MTEETIQETVAFGVGCFHFGLQKSSPPASTGSQYLTDLREQLESIQNVGDIEVESYLGFEEASVQPNTPLTSISDGHDFFPPRACGIEIDFEIYIPYRIQRELSPRPLRLFTGSETFKVHIRNPYDFPETFVEIVSPTADCQPSSAVIVVREYLKKQFEESKPGRIGFDCLGPSPFHADFFLSPDSASQSQ